MYLNHKAILKIFFMQKKLNVIKNLSILIIALVPFILTAQDDYCFDDPCLFWEEQPEAIDSNLLIYASNQWSIDEWDNLSCTFPVQQCENLRVEVYSPDLPDGEKRPLVVLIHGGAFVQGSRAEFRAYAQQLARLGYVAATIDYRLCKRVNCQLYNPLNLCGLNYWVDWGTSSYVATLDALSAIQYLQDNSDEYHIDNDNVIVGGASAGAWTALQVAYMQQEESDSLPGGVGRKNVWGELPIVSGIKGLFTLAGSMIDTAMIQQSESIPTFMVHGKCDFVLCYDFDAPFHCNGQYLKMHGSANIAEHLQQLNHNYYLYTMANVGHDVSLGLSGWEPELLRFLRENVVCGEPIQKHVVANLNQDSDECLLLPHSIRPNANLIVSDTFGIFSSPCEPTISTANLFKEENINVFPNPASNYLMVESEEPIDEVMIYSTNGTLMNSFKINNAFEKIDVSKLSQGAYFIAFILKERAVYRKFIKL